MKHLLHENEPEKELAILAGVDCGDYDAESSMAELEELAKSADAEVLATLIQKRERPNPATYLGEGKLAEIKEQCEQLGANVLIFDGELTPSQQRNIENLTDMKVVDRTELILDIFARRARSSEGKLQVELAQLNYRVSRLGGQGKLLSRLGGGIGTRGPGESKLESDKRHIRRRIYALENELKEVEKRRNFMRSRRKKSGVTTCAIVGYTNAGKSTLLNALTGAGVLAQDKLFATLDPTARALSLPDGRKLMLVDTVGFISRLPHQLVEAFKSTLEEAVNADLILNVCDAADPACAEQIKVTTSLLNELGCENTPIITVMNKCDLVPDIFTVPTLGNTVFISAKEGVGFEKLLAKATALLPVETLQVKLLIPFSEGGIIAPLREHARIHSETFTNEGTLLEVTAQKSVLRAYERYVVHET
ncbi:MAG: GTPase HflX [Clostridia bacterium]|nr:GTPase HflX [Clostridia bacterium]